MALVASAAYVKQLMFKCITLSWLHYYNFSTAIQISQYSKDVARDHQLVTILRTMDVKARVCIFFPLRIIDPNAAFMRWALTSSLPEQRGVLDFS